MILKLEVKKREKKENLNNLRKKGFIPAVLYARGIENVNLSVPEKEFNSIFKQVGESTILEISWDKEKRSVLINDIQYDYLKGKVMHIDFHQIRLDEKIKAEVELEFVGISPAVKNLGGVLVKNIQKIEVESLPQDLPHNFEVDISKLIDFETNIRVKDLEIPKGVKSLISDDVVIASITPPKIEEKEEVAEVDVSKVKVEGEEKKKKEEDEEKEEDKKKEDSKKGNKDNKKGKNKGK